MIRLNKTSYAHVRARFNLFKLEQESGMKLTTNIDEDFDELLLKNALSYIRIDYNNNLCFAMSHKLTKKEMELIKDITIDCSCAELAKKLRENAAERLLRERRKEAEEKKKKRKKK